MLKQESDRKVLTTISSLGVEDDRASFRSDDVESDEDGTNNFDNRKIWV